MWTPKGEINLINNWSYTEPIEADYIKLKHLNAKIGDKYWFAQASINSDNSVELFEIKVHEVKPASEEVFRVKKPALFTNRRLAFRKVKPDVALEDELRRVINKDYLNPVSKTVFAPQPSSFKIQIEVSDILDVAATPTPAPTPEPTPEPTPTPAPTPEPAAGKALIYSSNRDTNGLFYWIGTNYGAEAWVNPHTASRIVITSTPTYFDSEPIAKLVNRDDTRIWLAETAENNFVAIDIGASNRLLLSKVLLQHDGHSGGFIRNFKVQGSNNVTANTVIALNSATWSDLATFTNDTSVGGSYGYGLFSITTESSRYRWFRILQTGVNDVNGLRLHLGEIELYGFLQKV